jgi:hypothetical protein
MLPHIVNLRSTNYDLEMASPVTTPAVPDPRDLELSALRRQLTDLQRERDFLVDLHIGDLRRRARDPDLEKEPPHAQSIGRP